MVGVYQCFVVVIDSVAIYITVKCSTMAIYILHFLGIVFFCYLIFIIFHFSVSCENKLSAHLICCCYCCHHVLLLLLFYFSFLFSLCFVKMHFSSNDSKKSPILHILFRLLLHSIFFFSFRLKVLLWIP